MHCCPRCAGLWVDSADLNEIIMRSALIAGQKRISVLVVQDHVQERAVNLDGAVVFDEPSFRNRFMKKLTRDRVVPIISARVPG